MAMTEKVPYIPLTEVEQSAFCRTDETLDVKPLAEESPRWSAGRAYRPSTTTWAARS